MSTALSDFPHAVAVAAGFLPEVKTADAEGDAIELADTDGPYFAVQMVGAVAAGTTVSGEIQQSADGTGWYSIPGGAFADVTESEDVQTISFTPTLRYVRWIAGIAADMSPSAAVAAVIGRQKKTF